ncbi:MAG: M67 family metallopeptidase, partial [Halobacteria archaeon]|nr:M67 family metallopeptidase [Halobacteria archaeon]
RVKKSYPVENASETPRTNYLMESEDQLEKIEKIEDEGLEIVGFYHSHPKGPNNPSQTDAERATWPDHSYVIVSLRDDNNPFVGSWVWTGEEFKEEEVKVG